MKKLGKRNSMLLFELRHKYVGKEISHKSIEDVKCFTLTDRMICERVYDPLWNPHNKYNWLWRRDDLLDIYIPKKWNKVSKRRLHQVVADYVYFLRGSCLGYFAVEIDRMPKDMKKFRWLVYHNFNYLMNNKVSWEERAKKLNSFLDIEGDK